MKPLVDLTNDLSGRHYVTVSILCPALFTLINYHFADDNMSLGTEFCNYFKSVLLTSLRHRFNDLFTDKISLTSTFKNFSYRKFEFVKDLNERTKLLKEAQDIVNALYKKHLKEEENIQNHSNALKKGRTRVEDQMKMLKSAIFFCISYGQRCKDCCYVK